MIDNLADYSSFINYVTQFQEKLLEHHFKIEAQMEVLLMVNLNECPIVQLYNYLSAVRDLMLHSRDLSEQLLNSLIRATAYGDLKLPQEYLSIS